MKKMIDLPSSINSSKASIKKSKDEKSSLNKEVAIVTMNPRISITFNIVLSLPYKWMNYELFMSNCK